MPSRYLNQCWHSSPTHICITQTQWVNKSTVEKQEVPGNIQHYAAESRVFLEVWANTMVVDTLAPCLTRPLIAKIWTLQDEWVLVFHRERFQLPGPSEFWEITKNTNTNLCFLKSFWHEGDNNNYTHVEYQFPVSYHMLREHVYCCIYIGCFKQGRGMHNLCRRQTIWFKSYLMLN